MKRKGFGNLVLFAILVIAMFVAMGKVEAVTQRVGEPASVYSCSNGKEVVNLIGGFDARDYWVTFQSNTWSMTFAYMNLVDVDGRPGLQGSRNGANITVVVVNKGLNLVVQYVDKPVFTCDYIEQINLVGYNK